MTATDPFEEWLASPAGAAVTPAERNLMRVAWNAATERAAEIAEAAARRNEECPRNCRCGDGYHVAAQIRGGAA